MIVRLTVIAAFASACVSTAGAEPPPCHAQALTPPSPANTHVASDYYPILSAVLHEEGTTAISFVIGTDGKTSAPVVIQSSGSLRLDDVAIEAVRGWLYNPALADGAPTACVQRAQVNWVIPNAVEPPKKAQ